MICEQGDVVSLNFNPSFAHEPAGRHYAVVVSPWNVNRMSALTVVVPITSRDNGYPLHIPVFGSTDVRGFAECEGIRAIDISSREANGVVELAGCVDNPTLNKILATLRVVLGLD